MRKHTKTKRYVYESQCGDFEQRAPNEIEVWDYLPNQVAIKNHARLVESIPDEGEKVTGMDAMKRILSEKARAEKMALEGFAQFYCESMKLLPSEVELVVQRKPTEDVYSFRRKIEPQPAPPKPEPLEFCPMCLCEAEKWANGTIHCVNGECNTSSPNRGIWNNRP